MFRLNIFIPDNLQPKQRGQKYDLPLCDLFDEIGGDIVGSGTHVENGQVKSCDITVEVVDIEQAMPKLIQILTNAKSPRNTTISKSTGEELYRVNE